MNTMPSLLAPVEPQDLDKQMRHGMDDLVRRVAARAVIQGRGDSLLLWVYMAGFYHGSEATNAARQLEDHHADT